MPNRLLKSLTVEKVLLIAVLVLVVDSAYVAAYATPDLFYVVNALIHPLLGILAAILFAIYLKRHREIWRAASGKASVLLLAGAAALGTVLMVGGMTSPFRFVLYFHVGCSIAGLFFALVWLRGRSRHREVETGKTEQPVTAGSGFSLPAWTWTAMVMLGALGFYGTAAAYHHFFPNPEYIIHNSLSARVITYDEVGGKDRGKNRLMWPSSARTSNRGTIPDSFFLQAKSCEPCHKDIYHQWYDSIHHFSSFNDQWYRKSIEYMQDTVGIKPSMLCAGCHDQALAFTDMMQKYPIRKIEFTPQGQAGLTCVSCHAIVGVTSTMGNGSYIIEYPPLDRLVNSKNPIIRKIADYVVILDPKPHRAVFFKPFMHQKSKVAEFCSVCHKVHLDVPDNHYRWERGFDDYDNWQASGVSGGSARSFYYPPHPLTCVNCHMPWVRSNDYGNINGYVNSHRFAAANTAVPFTYGHWQQIQDVKKFLKGAVTVDLFAIAQEPKESSERLVSPGVLAGPQLSTFFAVGEESARGLEAQEVSTAPPVKLMAPLGRGVAYVRRGETVRVEVVVRTRRVGHFFPGGTADSNEVWVELKAVDNKGHIIFWSGEVADHGKGPVDPGAQFYRTFGLDERGHWINKRNSWAEHYGLYAHLIPPGAASTVHFRVHVPMDCGNKITFTAKLNYRKFDWYITQWAFAGRRDPYQKNRQTAPGYDNTWWLFNGNTANVSAKYKRIPNVPIVVMSKATVTIPVLAASNRPFEQHIKLLPQDLYRWNDYGIGLLLQGDLTGAARAFKMCTKINPKYADGWVNVARALVQEGNVNQAIPYLKRAIAINPELASAYYYMGQVYFTNGDYPQAYKQFAEAAAIHPVDRVVSNAMGRILFLERKYAPAVKQFKHTLSIDPENLSAHYNLMLCYRGLGEYAKSDREENLFMRFKADEAAEAIAGPYELTHPDDDNEAQPIHEEVSINDEKPAQLEYYWNYGQQWAWLPGKLAGVQQLALARCEKDGAYDYLAAMREAKLKLVAAHKQWKFRRRAAHPSVAEVGASP